MNPENAKAYGARGLAYSRKGNHNQAVADFTEAVRLDPNLAWGYCGRGIEFAQRRNSTKPLSI